MKTKSFTTFAEGGPLVIAVIGSAVVPTLIAQKFFQPEYKEEEEENHV